MYKQELFLRSEGMGGETAQCLRTLLIEKLGPILSTHMAI